MLAFISSAGVVGALILLAAIWGVWSIFSINKVSTAIKSTIGYGISVGTHANFGGVDMDLVQMYATNLNTTGASVDYNRFINLYVFLDLLKAHFDSYKVLYKSRSEYASGKYGNGHIVIEMKKGKDTIYIRCRYAHSPASKFDPPQYWDGRNDSYYDMITYIGEKDSTKHYPLCDTIQLVYPTADSSEIKTDIVNNIMEQCVLEYKEKIYEPSPTIYEVMYNEGRKQFSFSQEAIDMYSDLLPNPHLNYSKIKIFVGPNEYVAEIGAIIPLIQMALDDKTPVLINGITGSGKTKLLQYILSVISLDQNNLCLLTTPSTYKLIDDASFKSQIKRYKDRNIILVMDQAEKVLKKDSGFRSTALQYSDGILKDVLNLTPLMVFNGDPADMVPEMFRSGRAIRIEIGPLDAKTARAKVLDMRSSMDSKTQYLEVQFNKILSTEQSTPDGVVYAGKNEISLADLYSCFQGTDYHALLTAEKVGNLVEKAGAKKVNKEGKKEPLKPPVIQQKKGTPTEKDIKKKRGTRTRGRGKKK